MKSVQQWIRGFLKRHKDRFKPGDWPDGTDAEEVREFTLLWVVAFEGANVTEGEADAASRLLGPTPPDWRREHLEGVMAKIREQREIKTAAMKAAPGPASSCCYCSGIGLTIAWSIRPSREDRIPETTAAHCVCKHGREQRLAFMAKNPGSREILDFGEVLDGRLPGWLDRPPACPDLSAGAMPERPGRLRWREFAGQFAMQS